MKQSTNWLDAADPDNSAWVSANAGAGKTHTLANRVTRLLLAGAKPSRILCLTFTKAAAAEMQARLFDQLGKWAMLDDGALATSIREIGGDPDAVGLRQARRLFASALETPGGLKIQTIHAFCERLLSSFPVEAGVSPSFKVLDDQTAKELLGEARTQILERAGGGDSELARAVAVLVTETTETRLNQILDAAAGSDRCKLEAFFDGLGPEPHSLLRAAERAHGAAMGETFETIAEEFSATIAAEEDRLRAVISWLSGGTKSDGETGLALAQVLATNEAPIRFRLLCEALLKKDGELFKSYATKALAKAQPALLDYLVALAGRVLATERRCRAARATKLAHAALTIAREMRDDYARQKQARGVLDYDDLISRTLSLLSSRPATAWVLYKLDGGLDHVLVDEAQDTSPEQWRIIQKLTEEIFAGEGKAHETSRTIFAVGDEKQSIFSFQGAAPEEFERNRAYFAVRSGDRFADVRLETSRRSAPEVLRFVDAVFEHDEARAGLSHSPIAHKAHRADAKGRVELWPTIKPEDGPELDLWHLKPIDVESVTSPVARLADKIAAQIARWIMQRRRLPGHDNPIRPSDIMILLPRREPFASEVIRCLKDRDIPVAGADRMRLTEQIAVMDLIALGRFAVLPEDDLNLAALLRSPLIGISEDELRLLAYPRKGSLWSELSARREECSAYASARQFLAGILARADFAPPFEFYSRVLNAEGGRLKLLERLGPDAADALDEFVSLTLSYEQLATPSLEGFLHWLEMGEVDIKRDMERSRDEVRVMTVHGSKGLEADIVILPDTTALAEAAGRRGEFLYTENGVVFPLKQSEAPQAVTDAKAAAEEEIRKERRRLFYVALTRARDRLIVCGFENQHGLKPGSWYDLAQRAAQKLGTAITRDDETLLALGEDDLPPAESADKSLAPTVELEKWAKSAPKPERESPHLIRPSEALGLEEPASLSPAGKNAARFRRGVLVHAMLARLPDTPPQQRRAAALKYLSARGVAKKEAEALVAETLAVIEHTEFAAVFTATARAEAAIVAELPELGEHARVTGRLDRISVTDDEVLAVDFKTNRPPPARAEDVPALYLTQMALYRAALAKVFPSRRIACALVWTEGPSLMELPDALLDGEILKIQSRLRAS